MLTVCARIKTRSCIVRSSAFAWLIGVCAAPSTAHAHGFSGADNIVEGFAAVLHVATILTLALVKGPFRAKTQTLSAYILVIAGSLVLIKLFDRQTPLAMLGALLYLGNLLLGPILGYAWIAMHRGTSSDER